MRKKTPIPPPNPNDILVVQLTIPYSTSSHWGQQDRHVLGPQRAVDIEHRVLNATQYEFCNRPAGLDKFGSGKARPMSDQRLIQVVQHRPPLQAARLHHRQQPLHETAARLALAAE